MGFGNCRARPAREPPGNHPETTRKRGFSTKPHRFWMVSGPARCATAKALGPSKTGAAWYKNLAFGWFPGGSRAGPAAAAGGPELLRYQS